MVRRAASSQVFKRAGNNLVPPVLDKHVTSTDHVPFHRDIGNMCSWSKLGARVKSKEQHRTQVEAGSGNKHRFAAKLSIAKDRTKLPPYFVLKGAAFNGTR